MGAVTVTIGAEHPALAGHFPGAPILPGVLLLDEMLRAVEQERSCAGMRWRIGAAKFVKPVRPGETLTLEHEPLPNGSIAFRIASAGQAVAHGVLVPAIAPAARRSSRQYLRRALGREPGARDRYRQVFAFASTILDRLYLMRERYGLFAISIEGEELMRDTVARGSGAFLLGAHLGSFEI